MNISLTSTTIYHKDVRKDSFVHAIKIVFREVPKLVFCIQYQNFYQEYTLRILDVNVNKFVVTLGLFTMPSDNEIMTATITEEESSISFH